MQKCVYLVEMKEYGKLKDIVAANPYEKDSFAVVGYTLKDSKAAGMKGGFYVLFFKAEDPELVAKLKEKLNVLLTAKELDGEEREKIISQIEAEEDSAAAGLGSIFG
ncbi:MAG: hypothetical protein V1835_06565 [Candidatus Micrarchaeota archaeon]